MKVYVLVVLNRSAKRAIEGVYLSKESAEQAKTDLQNMTVEDLEFIIIEEIAE